MNHSAIRKFSLGLPDTVEQDHHGFPSFRVKGKIFATLPDVNHANVMLHPDDISAAIESHPGPCEGQMWGKKLAALRVDLTKVKRKDLEGWLTDAWERRANP